jgi:hypothetical protein
MMGARPRLMRLVNWVLKRDPHGTHVIHVMQRTTCDAECAVVNSPDEPQLWAIRHAARIHSDGGLTAARVPNPGQGRPNRPCQCGQIGGFVVKAPPR